MKKVNQKLIIVLIFLALFIWLTKPLWHWLFIFLYKNPSFWEGLIVIGIIYVIYRLRGKSRKPVCRTGRKEIEMLETSEEFEVKDLIIQKVQTAIVFIILLIFAWSILGFFQSAYSQCYLSENLKTEKITELPDMDPSVIRIMPQLVAERYAKDALQYPRYKLGIEDIAFVDKKPTWVFPLIPDGLINFFILKDKGAVYVDMNTTQKSVHIIEEDMEIGPGMGVRDWYKWKLYKEKYWVDYEDPYFVPIDEKLYIAAPIVSYEFHWRFPTFYTVPKWAGTTLIDSQGEVEFLTPKKTLKHPVLRNQKIYPERLARYYINSFRYVHGIINKLFYHRDQLEIAEVPEQRNEQPFLVVTEDKMKWFVACEPFGEAHGIFRIYLIDARTGKIQFSERPKAEALIGPVKSCDYVRKANPIVDWSRMIPVEPIPMISQGKLFWEVRVIPSDGSGIAYTVFVDSETSDATELHSDKAIEKFVKGEYIEEKVEGEKSSGEIIETIKELLNELKEIVK